MREWERTSSFLQAEKGLVNMAIPKRKHEEIETLNQEFLELIKAGSGVHAIMQKHEDGSVSNYYTKDLLSQYAERTNVFYTPNTMKTWKRRKTNVCELNAIVVDLDYYTMNLTRQQVLFALPIVLSDENILPPTAIQDSGNGLYLIWKLTGQVVNNQVMVRLYERITNVLTERLKVLGADSKATDVLHLFRFPGTTNVKKNKPVSHSNILELNSFLIYELEDFANEVLPEIKRKKKTPAKRGLQSEIKPAVKFLFNQYTLVISRAEDLLKLVQMRNYEMSGSRHFLLLYYSAFLMQAGVENYQKQAHELNDSLDVPMTERSMNEMFRSLENKFNKDSDSWYEKSYIPNNQTLVNTFDISEQEQRELKTIISDEEYKRRDRVRKEKQYEPIKDANKRSKQERDQMILEMIEQGITQKEIAQEMGVSVSTIKRVKSKK